MKFYLKPLANMNKNLVNFNFRFTNNLKYNIKNLRKLLEEL